MRFFIQAQILLILSRPIVTNQSNCMSAQLWVTPALCNSPHLAMFLKPERGLSTSERSAPPPLFPMPFILRYDKQTLVDVYSRIKWDTILYIVKADSPAPNRQMRTVLPSITPIFLSNESADGLFRDALWAHSVITLYAQIFIHLFIPPHPRRWCGKESLASETRMTCVSCLQFDSWVDSYVWRLRLESYSSCKSEELQKIITNVLNVSVEVL